MTRTSRRALTAALVAIVCAVAFATAAQANTTIPGLNGKIAYTTNANTLTFPGGLTASPRQIKSECAEFAPLGAEAGFGFDILCDTAEIATINPDGSGFTQVTNNDVPDDFAAWLPADGSKLAFQRTNLDETDCVVIFCGYNLYDTTTSGGHQLTTSVLPPSQTPGTFNASHPSYSPDGSTIAFEALNTPLFEKAASRDEPVDPVFKQFDHLAQTIYSIPAGGESAGAATPLVPADDYPAEPIVSDSQPAYSPDGTKIAFTRMIIEPLKDGATRGVPFGAVSSSIYVMPATGGEPTPVESFTPCDIPISNVAALLSGSLPSSGGSQPRGTLAQNCTWDAAPAWSPDGSKLAVERITFPSDFLSIDQPSTRGFVQLFDDSDIVVFNSSDGSGETDLSKVTEPSDCGSASTFDSGFTCGLDQKPAWSPDGTKIAFFSNRDSSGEWPALDCLENENVSVCDDEIWVMNADGSSPTQLTNNDVNDINPDWQRIPPPPAPPTPPAAPSTPPKVGVAGVRRACVSSSFHVRFHVATTASSVKSVVVKLDGKRIKSTTKSSFTLTINGKKLKSGRHRLTITATDSAGHVTTTHKSFSVCKAAKPRRKAAPRFTG